MLVLFGRLLQHCLDLMLHTCFLGADEKILTEFSLLFGQLFL